MSQHISGNIGQAVTHEDGPFITIGDFRVRKSLIQAYCYAQAKDGDVIQEGLGVTFSNGRIHVRMDSKEAADKEVDRLDWIFKKDYQE